MQSKNPALGLHWETSGYFESFSRLTFKCCVKEKKVEGKLVDLK